MTKRSKKQKKRILILNYEFPPLGGGGGVASQKLGKGFVKNGYAVDLITSSYKGLKKFEKVDGINVHRVLTLGRKNLKTASFISMLSCDFFSIMKGIALCFKHKYSFIISYFVIPTGPVGVILSKLFRIKHILRIIGGDIYDPSLKRSPHRHWYWRIIVRLIINSADVLTAISENTKENTEKYFGIKKSIKVIPIPYEKISYKNIPRKDLALDDDKIYLISVGRLVKRKGYKYLIKSLSLIDDKKVNLLIVSDGPEKNRLKKLAKRLGVQDRVKFLGYLETEELKFQYLAASDIYVLSSLHEGFGIVLQEAMQVGLPIVSTNYGGQVDVIKESENGLLVKPQRKKALAQAINKLLKNPGLRRRMQISNRKEIKKYEIGKIVSDYLSSK